MQRTQKVNISNNNQWKSYNKILNDKLEKENNYSRQLIELIWTWFIKQMDIQIIHHEPQVVPLQQQRKF